VHAQPILLVVIAPQVQKTLSRVLRSAGRSATGYASLLFPQAHRLPLDMQQVAAQARSAGFKQYLKLAGPGDRYMFNWQDEQGLLAWMEVATRPTETKGKLAAGTPRQQGGDSAKSQRCPSAAAVSSGSVDAGEVDLEVGIVCRRDHHSGAEHVTASRDADSATSVLQPADDTARARQDMGPCFTDLSRGSNNTVIALPVSATHDHILRDPTAAVLGLRPLLAGAAMMLHQARVEPALLRAGRPSFAADDWAGVLAACQLLITR
jgi:hypothetical protein